jgi:hypothetical protein
MVHTRKQNRLICRIFRRRECQGTPASTINVNFMLSINLTYMVRLMLSPQVGRRGAAPPPASPPCVLIQRKRGLTWSSSGRPPDASEEIVGLHRRKDGVRRTRHRTKPWGSFPVQTRHELRMYGVLKNKVFRSALRTATIGNDRLYINRGAATPRYLARMPTMRRPRSTARGNKASLQSHKPTRRATKRNISPRPLSRWLDLDEL